MKRREKGITLIALIITVIVMLILAGIGINLAIGDHGIFKKVEEGSKIYENAAQNETNELSELENEFEDLYNEAGNFLPEIEDVQYRTTTNSITVEVIAQRAKQYRFSYKKVEEENYSEPVEQEENIYDFTGLEDNVTYSIKIEAINDGRIVERELEITTKDMAEAEGTIDFENLVWENKKASIGMITDSEYEIQYQINGEEEEGWTTGSEVGNLSVNDIVYARLFDGVNGGSTTSITIMEIIPPHVNIHVGQITSNTIEVSTNAEDNQSGMPDSPIYKYYIKKSSEANYQETANYEGTQTSYTFSGLTHNTEYDIKITTSDIAGNEGEITSEKNRTVQVTAGNGAITFSGISWSGGKASISMSTTTSYTIQYQVNSTTGNWTTATTASNLNLNDTVYARLWDGVNGGDSVNTKIVDTAAPNAASIKLGTTATTTGASISVEVTQTDSQSGVRIGNCKWVYNTTSTDIGTNAASYTGGTFSNTTQTINLSVSSPGTYYLHVLTIDNAGNARETKSGAVTVRQLVTSVGLNKSSTSLKVGATEKLTATVNPSNANNRNVNWSSSNTSVATVSGGTITAKAKGTATITATAADGSGKSASCTVTVTQPVTGVSLNKSSTSLKVGATEKLTATVTPSNANNMSVNWSSSNTSVATVSGGTITAKAKGTATITATAADGSGKSASCTVTVTQPVTGVSLNKSSTSLKVGATEKLTATVNPSNANNRNVNWSSSNTSVATVSGGTITAKAKGTATITATAADGSGKSASCTVTVIQPVTGVSLNKSSTSLKIGATEKLTATVTPSNANNMSVNWSTSNSTVATVSGGTITAKAAGSATITATAADGSGKSASCTVTVTKPGNPDSSGIYRENSTVNGGTESYKNPTIPKGFKPVNDGNAKWGDANGYKYGLIIQDAEGNQFVWVAVDGTTVKLDRYTFADNGTPTGHGEAGIKDRPALYTYTERTTAMPGNTGNTLAKDINAFKTSVGKHGGYYIARYEASYGTDGKANSKVSTSYSKTVSSVEGRLWNNVTQPNAATACRNMYGSSHGAISDLMNSYAWDTALVFIQKYSGDTDYSKQPGGTGSLANTGTNGDQKCHIHDMAGNCYEWTTETCSHVGYPCSRRGGWYANDGQDADNRGDERPGDKNDYTSFRPILYL